MRPHESLHRQDMKDVGFEEPAPEALFNPEVDITQADRDSFTKYLLYCKTKGTTENWFGLCQAARALDAIDPSFNIQTFITNPDREDILKSFSKYIRSSFGSTALSWAKMIVAIHGIDPSLNLEAIPSVSFPLMYDALRRWRADTDTPMNWFNVAQISNALRFEDPTFSIKKEVPDQDFAAMQEALPTFIEINRWDLFAAYAIMLHDLGRDSGLWPPISLPDRATVLAVLEEYRHHRPIRDRMILCHALSLLSESQGNLTSTESPVQPLPTFKTY